MANRHLAMGVSGPLQKTVTSSVDVTNTTKEDHYQAYFKKLSQMLKELFGI
ncbi:hypothetical protein ACFWMP_15085 [Paenibacillus sp. NPDC058367]|uniref:hypothetical protein n=1 Tax=Paenibacillus sp. NPDC058367 TaxID=3346460 RepID=UPI003655A495